MSQNRYSLFSFEIGVGNVIACLLSAKVNEDIIWAIIHGLLGWLYVIYYVLTKWLA